MVTVDEQAFEQVAVSEGDAAASVGAPDRPTFRPTVEQETQAKVDSNHPDGIVQDLSHLPLAQAEEVRAREAELDRIRARAAVGPKDGRAERTRQAIEATRAREREHASPDLVDPRETLTQRELAEVNQAAQRIVKRLDTQRSRASIAKAVATRVRHGQELTDAVFGTMDALKASPGTVCPIADVPEVGSDEVTVHGEVVELWDASSPAIDNVGLLADETGTTKVTTWQKSRQPGLREGDRVTITHAKRNWYEGRCSLALTTDSMVCFEAREA